MSGHCSTCGGQVCHCHMFENERLLHLKVRRCEECPYYRHDLKAVSPVFGCMGPIKKNAFTRMRCADELIPIWCPLPKAS